MKDRWLSLVYLVECQQVVLALLAIIVRLFVSYKIRAHVKVAFDVVKTRMQGLRASEYKNTLDCVGQMFKKEGISAFYVGVIPRLGRVIPGQYVKIEKFKKRKCN